MKIRVRHGCMHFARLKAWFGDSKMPTERQEPAIHLIDSIVFFISLGALLPPMSDRACINDILQGAKSVVLQETSCRLALWMKCVVYSACHICVKHPSRDISCGGHRSYQP